MILRITMKGRFQDESQLIGDEPLPEGSVMFKEGGIEDVLRQGITLMLPLLALMTGLMVFRFVGLKGTFAKAQFFPDFFLTFALIVLLAWLLTYVHEFIHALFFPWDAEKQIWKYPEKGAFFIYCSAPVSRWHFVVLSLAPGVLLGVVPYLLWLWVAGRLPILASIGMAFLSIFLTMGAMGDVANVYNCLTQVPRGAQVFGYGLHTYWREEHGSRSDS